LRARKNSPAEVNFSPPMVIAQKKLSTELRAACLKLRKEKVHRSFILSTCVLHANFTKEAFALR
jgi:hypothetical protein